MPQVINAHFSNTTLSYLKRMKEIFDTKMANNEPELSLAEMFPGIVFREFWPALSYHYSNTPLRPNPSFHVAQGEEHRVARKGEGITCDWLRSCFEAMLNPECDPNLPIRVIVIGDSLSDSQMANNFNRKSSDMRDCKGYGFFKAKPSEGRELPQEQMFWSTHWQKIEEAAIEFLDSDFVGATFLIIDVDRTLLLPVELCDDSFRKVGRQALRKFVHKFCQKSRMLEFTETKVWDAFKLAKECNAYSSPDYFRDQDVRALYAFALLAGLNLESDVILKTEVHALLDILIEACSDSSHRFQDIWHTELLLREFLICRMEILRKEPSFFKLYRSLEEDVLNELGPNCRLNGHIINIYRQAVDKKQAFPIAFSDRPGASVGLVPGANFVSLPRRIKSGNLTFFETPVKLIYEE